MGSLKPEGADASGQEGVILSFFSKEDLRNELQTVSERR
jgi:hypothetical protein